MNQKVDWKNKMVSEMLPFQNGNQLEKKERFIKVLASFVKQNLQNK
jgi:hypothetical protein